MEFLLILVIALFIVIYRMNTGAITYKFIVDKVGDVYEKFAPYSFKKIREKVKELGMEYTAKQYTVQVIIFAGGAFVVSYLYFYNIITSIFYMILAVAVIPYLAYLRCKRVYSEFIFEQIQVYTTNTIMEFNTTQSFIKALEGVVESGVLDEPVLSDVKTMIALSYEKGDVTESINYMNAKYPYYMVKNMHQLFLQITKEGARDSGESLENMSMDIDTLVEGVYRDQMDRKQFHTKFLTFGIVLFFLVLVMQLLLGRENYVEMASEWYVQIILHAIIIINSFFLVKGEKFYNEDVGVE